MRLSASMTTRSLCALCTGALLAFLLASWIDDVRAPVARAAYILVYLCAAGACLAVGQSARSPKVRWGWLAPAILAIPAAILVALWSLPASDFVALLFYPFAALAAVPRASGMRERSSASGYVDLLLTCASLITVGLYVVMLGVRAIGRETPTSFYVPLAPAAAALLIVPALGQAFPRSRQRARRGGYLLTLGLGLSVFSDVTAVGIAASPFLWACAVWLIALGAAQASRETHPPQASWVDHVTLPAAWWPAAAVASVYALIVVTLERVEPAEVRVLTIGGTVITTLVLVRQISGIRENSALREARRMQEARFRRLGQHSTDVVLVLDRNGCILYHCPALAALLGLASGEHIGVPIGELLRPEDASSLHATLDLVCDHPGRSRNLTFSLRCHDGRTREVEMTATNRCDEPALAGIVVNIRDITERTQLERRLAHQNKMEGVGLMAAGVAHEFNNLLTIIMGHMDLLADDSDVRRSDDQALVEIRDAVNRAAELTRSLLGIARKEQGETGPIDANAIIARVVTMVRSGIGPEYEVDMDLASSLWLANSNARDLEHTLLNLALNARDAMPAGGALRLRTQNVYATALPRGTAMPVRDYIRITVQDTGHGMPPEVLARAFQPFFTTKPEGQGTGLGLAIAYAAIRQSGGFIDVSSAVGAGTTFTLWLPRA